MSIEEKAKAYDEALDRMKHVVIVPKNEKALQALKETIFHELCESKNERIRKKCIELIKRVIPSGDTQSQESKDILDCISYLEKQKEQKSTLRTERIRPKFAVGDTVCRPMWSEHTIREIYVRCNDPVYICVNEEGTESHILMSEQDEWERKEQKPIKNVIKEITKDKDSALKFLKSAGIINENGELAEMYRSEQKYMKWSEKDEEHLRSIESTIECAKAQFPNSPAIIEAYNEDLSWLHSFLPSQKAEWSEEDEEIFNNIIEKAKSGHWIEINEITWLINCFKLLRHQPKPAWSEKDEDRIEYIVGSLESLKKYVRKNIGMSEEYKEHIFRRLEQEQSWLKSLRPIVNANSEKVNVNWSEEDEKQLDDIISIIREAYEHGITISETRHRNAYFWLNELRPSWKPSEEQMRGLKFFLDFHRSQRNAGTTNWREYDALRSLYDDLQKLT